jgi:hypothetical protein
MPFSKRSLEGYLLVDHRGTVGVDGGRGALFESPTVTCSHCQRQVVLNPSRTRDRGYCPKCDHYVCDACEAVRVASGGACRTFKQIMDDYEKAVLKQERIHG